MKNTENSNSARRTSIFGAVATGVATALAAILTACQGVVSPGSAPVATRPVEPTPLPPPVPTTPVLPAPTVSNASTPRDYRRAAASNIYEQNASRIYKGRLPPHLYAVGVLQVEINRTGDVMGISWMRAPRHAPEVMAEIEKTVRAAAPYPLPAKMGRVTYTDTWLWDKSGKFQLDTLTEGQD